MNKPSVIALSVFLTIGFLPAAIANDKAVDYQEILKKGNGELGQGNTEKAIEIFRSKVSKYPNSGACHTALGKALKRQGKQSDAKAEFSCATEVEPTYPEGFYELGVSLESDKDYPKAAQAFKRYAELDPDGAQRQNVADRIQFCSQHD